MSGTCETSLMHVDEENILASFTGRLIEIAHQTDSTVTCTDMIRTLDALQLPAIALNSRGVVLDMTHAASPFLDQNVQIKNNRLLLQNSEARAVLRESLAQLRDGPQAWAVLAATLLRAGKPPVILRLWPCRTPDSPPEEAMYAILTFTSIDAAQEKAGQVSCENILQFRKSETQHPSLPAADGGKTGEVVPLPRRNRFLV